MADGHGMEKMCGGVWEMLRRGGFVRTSSSAKESRKQDLR